MNNADDKVYDTEGKLRAEREKAGVTLGEIARKTGKDKGHLSRVEKGERPVTPILLYCYRCALGVEIEFSQGAGSSSRVESLTMRNSTAEDSEDAMQRRTLLGSVIATATGAAAAVPIDSVLSTLPSYTAPATVTTRDVLELQQATDLLTQRDAAGAGYSLVAEGRALLEWASNMARHARNEQVRQDLAAVSAYLADRTAWVALNLGHHSLATHLLGLGLRLATEADDPNLSAQILCDMAGHSVFIGKATDALAYAEIALADNSILPQLRSALHAVMAEAYGARGYSAGVRDRIDAAIDCADDRDVNTLDVPGWIPAFRTKGTLSASTGLAASLLFDAKPTKTTSRLALEYLEAAVETLGGRPGRSATLARVRLATLHLASTNGDRSRGLSISQDAATEMTHVRSVRVQRELHSLYAALRQRKPDPACDDIRQRVAALLNGQATQV
ncbi:helix-turn-helix domain-containing protein [Haloglycomyces albus]|uniref:helix-turn-helix domain-containing protein n=1 Tax=Haloglycomyces albus TaxID=526067 RepID=UPI00046D01A2|nr:helix-turn-helix transcriptional regulator [Haloglycomyces albus]